MLAIMSSRPCYYIFYVKKNPVKSNNCRSKEHVFIFYGIVSKQMFILVIRKQLRPLGLGKVIVSRYDDNG